MINVMIVQFNVNLRGGACDGDIQVIKAIPHPCNGRRGHG